MSAWVDILGVGASAASGGVFGLVGTVIGRVAGYFEKKQEYSFKLKEWEHEAKLQEMQMRARAQETEQEIILANARGTWDGLASSQAADAEQEPSYLWVAAVRSLTRPAITFGLIGFICVRWFFLPSGDEAQYISESLVFTAMTAVTWWFGTRPVPRGK